MKDIVASLRPALVLLGLFSLICGIGYPMLVTATAQVIPHPSPAELIGQTFIEPGHFWGRPSAIGYDAATSSGANLAMTNAALNADVQARVDALRTADPGNTVAIPVDLVTMSGSGLDPDISPAAAYYQVARVARARGLDAAVVRAVVDAQIEERTLGVLGERRVNVVSLNRAVERLGGE